MCYSHPLCLPLTYLTCRHAHAHKHTQSLLHFHFILPTCQVWKKVIRADMSWQSSEYTQCKCAHAHTPKSVTALYTSDPSSLWIPLQGLPPNRLLYSLYICLPLFFSHHPVTDRILRKVAQMCFMLDIYAYTCSIDLMTLFDLNKQMNR